MTTLVFPAPVVTHRIRSLSRHAPVARSTARRRAPQAHGSALAALADDGERLSSAPNGRWPPSGQTRSLYRWDQDAKLSRPCVLVATNRGALSEDRLAEYGAAADREGLEDGAGGGVEQAGAGGVAGGQRPVPAASTPALSSDGLSITAQGRPACHRPPGDPDEFTEPPT
jgi:hypothetical protein